MTRAALRASMNVKPREVAMREERTRIRVVKRKLAQGRPGRPGDEPAPTFDWERVVNASQKKTKSGHAVPLPGRSARRSPDQRSETSG